MYLVTYHNLRSCTSVQIELDDVFDKITESEEFENYFDDIIDDEEVVICGVPFCKSVLLKSADRLEYEFHKDDFAECIREEVIEEISNDLETKGYSEKYGFTIKEDKVMKEERIMEKRTFTIELSKEDFEILDKYGFFYEKNFEEQSKDVANQLRECERRIES